jgi:hypothetical protein
VLRRGRVGIQPGCHSLGHARFRVQRQESSDRWAVPGDDGTNGEGHAWSATPLR